MHRGCDNFWMYENVRQEPVLSLANSDNYNLAALTDNYVPLPNGGGPNHLNSYLSPQNSVTSSHQIGNQFKITDPQCMWPSSVYSLTFRSSYANNFQSPETYSSQSTNLNCSTQNSQVQQNYYSKHLNTNLNFAQVFSNTNTNINNTTTYTYTNNNNDDNINSNNNINNNNNGNNNNNNTDNCNSVRSQNIKNNVTPISRIRVRDVFSLNNNTLHNSLLENDLLQTHQKEQTECPLNCATVNNSASFGLKTPTEYVDYEKVNLVQSNPICSPYGYTTVTQAKPCNSQKFFQPSDLYCQKNRQVSIESQFQFSDSKKMEKNLPSETFSNDSLTEKLSNPKKIWEAGTPNVQKKSCDALFKSKRVKVQPKRNSNELSNLQNLGSNISREKNNNIYYTDSLKASEKVTHETSNINRNAHSQSHRQKNLSEIDEESSLSQVSPTEELREFRKSSQSVSFNQKYSNNQIEAQKNNLVKITVPHTGRSSFININYSSNIEKNPTLNFPRLLESRNQLLKHALSSKSPDHNHSKTENNGVINLSLGQINQGNSISSEVISPNTNPVCGNTGLIQNKRCDANVGKFDHSFPLTVMSSLEKLKTSNEGLGSEEHLVGLNKPENYASQSFGGISENILDGVNSKIFVEEESHAAESISHNDTLSKAVVIKQENLQSEVESPIEQFVPEDQVFPQIIKMENTVEDFSLEKHEQESPISENRVLENTPFVDDTENIDINKANVENANAEKPGPKSKVISEALKNDENPIQELNLSVDNSSKEKADFSPKNKMKRKESKVRKKKVSRPRRKYKSKINKKKLDLLIQFLNKDEEAVEMNTSEERESGDCLEKNYLINKEENEVRLSRNRRKLNKTRVVKNKNNSREMISMISHKDSRVEILKCSSKNPQIAQTVENLDKSEEKFEEDSSAIERNVDFLENNDKINNHFQENQTQEENCLKPDSEKINISACNKKQDTCETEKCFSEKESNIQERNDISNAVQTFQNLKTHFCMSCELISSVDSFWINVVSGELRCLNCFKKMLIRTEKHILKSESEVGGKCNSEASLLQKRETNQSSESRKENKDKPGFEGNCNELITALQLECDHQKSNELKENIKQEVKEIINESSESDITIKNDEEMNFMSKYCTVSAINFSNTSERKSVEDKTSLLWKTEKKQKELKVEESLNKSVENIKWEEIETRKSKVLDVSKQEITEIYEKSKKVDEVADETQNSGAKVLPAKSKQMNVLKEKSVSSKANLSKNCNEENFLHQSVTKNDFAASCDTNKTQISMEGVKPGLTDKLEKSNRKATSKEEGISKEFTKMEKRKNIDMPNQNGKKTSANEEFTCKKLQILEEHSNKEMKTVNSLDESIAKTCSKENYSCQKSHSLEGIVRRDSKHEPLDKLNVQNSLKEIGFDQRPKISRNIKIKETDMSEKSKKKCLPCQNFTEKHKKVEGIDHSRKRQNIDEDFAIHKVHFVEEHAKKVKRGMHSPDKSKEDNAERKNKTLEHERQNAKDFGEKSGKNSWSKEGCTSFGKKETNQVSGSSEKSKTKGDWSCQKANTSKLSNILSEMPRRKSKVECICLKPIICHKPKKHSEKEIKKSSKLSDKLRRKSTSKEDSGSLSKRFKIESLPAECKENKTMEGKKKKQFRGKIPKKSPTGSDININEALRSPLNYESEEISNMKVKKDQFTRIKEECQNKKCSKESFKNRKRNSNRRNEKTENKEEKETFQRQSDTKTGKEIENDSKERKDQRNQMQGSDGQNLKAKKFEYFSEEKTEDMAAKKSRPNGYGSEKTMLLTELIKKTKKLTWTLLNAVP